MAIDMRHSLFFSCSSFILTSFAFASARSCALVMFVAGVCFQRCELSLVLAIVRWSGQGRKRVVEENGRRTGQFISVRLCSGGKAAKRDGVSTEWILEFDILPSLPSSPWSMHLSLGPQNGDVSVAAKQLVSKQ
jgi:hypothetical protein